MANIYPFDPRTARSALTALRGGYGSAGSQTVEALARQSGSPMQSETPYEQIKPPSPDRTASGTGPTSISGNASFLRPQNSSAFGGGTGSDIQRPAYNLLSGSSGSMSSPDVSMSRGTSGRATPVRRDLRAELLGLAGPSMPMMGNGPDELIAMMLRGGFHNGTPY